MFDIYVRFPVLLWPVGPVILVWALWAFNRILRLSKNWPRVNGVVQEINMDTPLMRGVGRVYLPRIKVAYSVNSHNYTASFQWDAGINADYAKELIADFRLQGLTSLQYAPFDPSITRLRFGSLCNEAWVKYVLIGGLGLLLSTLTTLSIVGNLLISSPVRTIVVTATPLMP